MPLIIDDSFYDDLGASLPARSLSLLLPAASWSARRSKSGFVPAWMVAKLSDDPDRDTGPLQAAGIVRRVKGGGMQITEGKGITIINADAAAAEAELKREQGRVRAQRKRDRDRAARTAALSEAVARDGRVTSRSPAADVTQAERPKRKKTQVSGVSVTRYEPASSRVTPGPSRADARQDDFELELDPGLVGQSSAVDAYAREDDALAGAVTAAVREREGFGLDRESALKVGALALARRKKGPPTDRPAYAAAVIANEKDLFAVLLRDIAPPLAEIIAEPVLPPGAHPFRPDDGFPPSCLDCNTRKTNYRHQGVPQEAAS